jgi:hypothetical protein
VRSFALDTLDWLAQRHRNVHAQAREASCGHDPISQPERCSPCSESLVDGGASEKIVLDGRAGCCHFFHSHVVFSLTLRKHESIHSSTAFQIAASMQPIEKGRIGKWQLRKQPRRHPRRRPRRKPRRKSNGSTNQRQTPRGTQKASPSVFLVKSGEPLKGA